MSTLEREKLEYITKTQRELLELQFQLTGEVDDELFEEFEKNVKTLYNNKEVQ